MTDERQKVVVTDLADTVMEMLTEPREFLARLSAEAEAEALERREVPGE